VDPFSVLGVRPGASSSEVSAAYRRLAKRWHPDRGGGASAQQQMAQINVAYDLLRESLLESAEAAAAPKGPGGSRPASAARRVREPGSWLPRHVRKALGGELCRALEPGESVAFVVPAAQWASPHTILAVTDRRLLWLLDDAVAHRVRWLRFRAVDSVTARRSWPLRRRAVLRVCGRDGRRFAFADLRPATAAAIAAAVRARV
jgi:hypothetical protein